VRFGVFKEFVDASSLQAEIGIIGQQRIKRQFEETVQRASPRIDGGNSRRSQHNVFLLGMFADIPEKGRLSRTRFPRQENRLAGVLYEVQGILKLLVLSVGYEGHMHSWLSTLNFRLFRIVLVHWLCRCRQRS